MVEKVKRAVSGPKTNQVVKKKKTSLAGRGAKLKSRCAGNGGG